MSCISSNPLTHTHTHVRTIAATISSPPLRHHIHYLHPGFPGSFAGVSRCRLALRLFGLCENTFYPLGTRGCRIYISVFFFLFKTPCVYQKHEFRYKLSVCFWNKKKNPQVFTKNWNSRHTRRHATEISRQHGSQIHSFFNLTAGTHALIVSFAWQIFPFELSRGTRQVFHYGTCEFCTSGIFISFDWISRTLLSTLLKWSPLVILNHICGKKHCLCIKKANCLYIFIFFIFVDGNTNLSPGFFNRQAFAFKWFLSRPWCVWNYWLPIGATKDVHARWFFRARV